MTAPAQRNEATQIAREEMARIYTRTVSPLRPPNAATAWERERLRRAARELVRGKRGTG